MAVCCATQLVASTVVCSSGGAALILFKLCGLWTECWTDCSRLERAQCLMWGIKLAKALSKNFSFTYQPVHFDCKYYCCLTLFSAIIKYFSLRIVTTIQWTCQHKMISLSVPVPFTLNSRYTAICAVSKTIFFAIVY